MWTEWHKRTAVRIFLQIAVAILTTGCIVLPVPTSKKITAGTEVSPGDVEFLQVAVTTKAEVLQHLGQPTILWRDENTLVYRWVRREGLLLWAVGSAGGASDITREFAFLIKCDQFDRYMISELVMVDGGKSFGQVLLDWRDAQRRKAGGAEDTKP